MEFTVKQEGGSFVARTPAGHFLAACCVPARARDHKAIIRLVESDAKVVLARSSTPHAQACEAQRAGLSRLAA